MRVVDAFFFSFVERPRCPRTTTSLLARFLGSASRLIPSLLRSPVVLNVELGAAYLSSQTVNAG
jgi:hypothetical protein